MSNQDPTKTNPELYSVIFENDRVRVLRYLDKPDDMTQPHHHPDSVMITLSAFRRTICAGGREMAVDLPAGQARWLDAQEHSGHNTGDSETHTIFVELKEPNPAAVRESGQPLSGQLGPSLP